MNEQTDGPTDKWMNGWNSCWNHTGSASTTDLSYQAELLWGALYVESTVQR